MSATEDEKARLDDDYPAEERAEDEEAGRKYSTVLENSIDQQINAALALDLDVRPCSSREGGSYIEVHKQEQTNQTKRLIAVSLAKI